MLPVIIYEGIGYLVLWQGQKKAETLTPWYVDAGLVLAGGYSQSRGYVLGRSLQRVSVATGRGAERAVRFAARQLFSKGPRPIPKPGQFWLAGPRSRVASRGLLGTASMYVSAIGAGYMIGAVVGTAISQKIWGDEGARHALDFYTGNGNYGEYFDIVGNVNTIYNAYHSGN